MTLGSVDAEVRLERVLAGIRRVQNMIMGASETESEQAPVDWAHLAWVVFDALQSVLYEDGSGHVRGTEDGVEDAPEQA